MKRGFLPIAEKNATILILGTIPGEESLKKNEYYANPRNSFWKILASLLEVDPPANYMEKSRLLAESKIALWDVIQSCRRVGSLDARIVSNTITANDFASFFNRYPNIRNVFFNGARAEQEYIKRVLPELPEPNRNMELVRLPSTSPAMARLSFDEKYVEWSKILVRA